ncbi:MAPEG family protein [Sorangium atrum]|uniref:MAPEG family protein n=1 Tax=Sorangium atrum TaxID=2995308 RepID=A0ABT5BS30_9BACT|nr:MAPEG family protein [Sorangium aterium]MDC0676976.1 MAPEG family protein [Sorangium aterium]
MTIPMTCVFISLLLIYVARLFVAKAQSQQPEGLDNHNPRDQQAKLTGVGRRALAAHQNGFEAFAPFAAGVFTAHLAGADARWSAILAVTHVAARVLVMYLADKASARTAVWIISFAATVGLFLLKWLV